MVNTEQNTRYPLGIVPHIDLKPEDYLWANWQQRTPLDRPEVKPLDRDKLKKQLKQISVNRRCGDAKTWTRGKISISLTSEEARFWANLMVYDSPKVANTDETITRVLARETPSPEAISQWRDDLLRRCQTWPFMIFPEILIPLSNLLRVDDLILDLYKVTQITESEASLYAKSIGIPLKQITSEVKEARFRGYSHNPGNGSRFAVRRTALKALAELLDGFRIYLWPHLSQEELHEWQEKFRPAIERIPKDTWDPLVYFAAFLKMDDIAQQVIDSWDDSEKQKYTKLDFYETGRLPVYRYFDRYIPLALKQPELIKTTLTRFHLTNEKDEIHQRALLAILGVEAIDLVHSTKVISLIKAPEVVPKLLSWLSDHQSRPTQRKTAEKWFQDHPALTVVGLILMVANANDQEYSLTQQAINYLGYLRDKDNSYRDLIVTALNEMDCERIDGLRESLKLQEQADQEQDPATSQSPEPQPPEWLRQALRASEALKKINLPSWCSPHRLPKLSINDYLLSTTELSLCVAALRESSPDAVHPLIQALKDHGEPGRLESFAWRLFSLWQQDRSGKKDGWAMLSLGYFGSDAVIDQLSSQIQGWPSSNLYALAELGLDCLCLINTPKARHELFRIATETQYSKLLNVANSKLKALAEKQGMSPDQLWIKTENEIDQEIPTFGLSSSQPLSFDFGPRQFQLILGPDMKPKLQEDSGKIRDNLPKPNRKDDPKKAEQSTSDWRSTKQQIQAEVKLQTKRLELAMIQERRWSPAEFQDILVMHPWLTYLLQRLVWSSFDNDGAMLSTFRVAEDRSYSTEEDDPYSIDNVNSIGIIHPIYLSDKQKQIWTQLFVSYEILQPFRQLHRTVFPLGSKRPKDGLIREDYPITLQPVTFHKIMSEQGWHRDINYNPDLSYPDRYTRRSPTGKTEYMIHYLEDPFRLTGCSLSGNNINPIEISELYASFHYIREIVSRLKS